MGGFECTVLCCVDSNGFAMLSSFLKIVLMLVLLDVSGTCSVVSFLLLGFCMNSTWVVAWSALDQSCVMTLIEPGMAGFVGIKPGRPGGQRRALRPGSAQSLLSSSESLINLLLGLILGDAVLLGDLVNETVLVAGDRLEVFGSEFVKLGAEGRLELSSSVGHCDGLGLG